MRNYIILTKEQADLVRGGYGKRRPDGTYPARIEPVEFPDGKFAIPEVCSVAPLLKDAHKKVLGLKKVCTIQDIEDLNEEKGRTIEEGKYYLSKDYWVIKALQSKQIKLSADTKLTTMPEDFLIRNDFATMGDAEIAKRVMLKRQRNIFVRIYNWFINLFKVK